MPFTFLAHQLPILPVARYGRQRFDGLALVFGSMAPDLAFAFWLTPLYFDSHTLVTQFWWSIPVAAAMAIVTRRVLIEPLSLALPDAGPFHIHDYSYLAKRKQRLLVTLYSAALGALTHIVLDSFTHVHGFMVIRWSVLQEGLTIFGSSMPLWHWLQYLGHTVGSALTLGLLAIYGSRRWALLANDNEAKLARVHLPRTLVIGLAVGIALASIVMAASWSLDGPTASLMRGFWMLFLSLLISGELVRRHSRRAV